MSQVSYGTITITDMNDIEEIYTIYAGSNTEASPTFTYAAVTGGTIWKRNASALSGLKYIWQSTVVTKSGVTVDSTNWQQFYSQPVRLTGLEGDDARNITDITPYYYLSTSDSSQTGGSWSTTPQPYPSTGTAYYWTKTITTYDSGSPTESTAVLDMFLTNAAKDARDANTNAAIANSIAAHANEDSQGALGIARAMQQNFWWWGEDHIVDSSFTLPPGAYTSDIKVDAFKANPTGGYLVTRSDGIYLNNGRYVLMGLTGNALKFYRPGTTKLLSGTETIDAQLDSNGLTLSKGGIKVIPSGGAIGDNNSVYISSNNLGSKVASLVNDNNKTNWRAIIGSKFGVDSEGNLYANEAHIIGAIKATSGIIGNNAQNKIIIGDNIANASIYSGSHSTLASTANGFYIGTDGLSIGSNFKVTTAGALTASDLTVNSGSIANSVTIGGKNQSEYLNDNIEVGGRNLLYNSGTMPAVSSGDKGWRASGGTVSHIDISTSPIAGISGGIRCTNTGSSAARVGIVQDLLANRFIAGKKYSMGCWIRASAEFSSDVAIQPIWISSSQTTNSKYISMTLSTNWQYISAESLVLNGDQASSYSAGYVYASDVPAGGYIEVCGIMLEEGTKCTSWTPAPEDVASDIEDASKVATNYLTFDETNGLDIGYTGKIEHTNIKGDGMRIYVTNENDSAELVASFLSNGSTIGKVADGESRTVTSNKGMRFYKRSGSNDITLAHIGYDQGVDEDGNTNIYAPYYTFGKRKNGSTIGNYSMAEGSGTNASGAYSHAEGNSTTASGSYSHAEGWGTTASGHCSHAEGSEAIASKYGSHAEGTHTTASGDSSHAEGSFTTASGSFSHVEGFRATASGQNSHAGGYYTVAGYSGQTVIGKYNSNKSNTAFEIGNGNDSKRSNALTVDWNGNIVAAGGLTLDGNKPLIRITEKGTEGHWRYRLWSDGRYEAWYNSGQATVTLTTSSGNGWYRNADAYIIASPSWASTVHYVTVQAMVSGYANIITSLSAANSSEIKYYVSHLGSLSKKPAYITAYITGAWM